MKVEIRPTLAEDLPRISAKPLPTRIMALTVTRGDEVLGIGGLTFLPDGTVAAFVEMQDGAARKYPVTAHKAALRTMQRARAAGYRRVVATANLGNPVALRWLARLGFRPLFEVGDEQVWVWEG